MEDLVFTVGVHQGQLRHSLGEDCPAKPEPRSRPRPRWRRERYLLGLGRWKGWTDAEASNPLP